MELASLQLIELHSVPRQPGRMAGYRIGEDQSGGNGDQSKAPPGPFPQGRQSPTKSLESVRKHQAGLQSFRSMRRIEASRRNASALRLRFSQSLASLRQRLSQAKVRSTTQRRGSTTNPFVRSERLTISISS